MLVDDVAPAGVRIDHFLGDDELDDVLERWSESLATDGKVKLAKGAGVSIGAEVQAIQVPPRAGDVQVSAECRLRCCAYVYTAYVLREKS